MSKSVILFLLLIPALSWSEEIDNYTAMLTIGDWEPGREEIVNSLDLLKHNMLSLSGKSINFHEYRFQYYGVTRNKNEVVVINGFCSAFWKRASHWRTELVMVKDGGSCFLHAEYSVNEKKIVSLRFNGES